MHQPRDIFVNLTQLEVSLWQWQVTHAMTESHWASPYDGHPGQSWGWLVSPLVANVLFGDERDSASPHCSTGQTPPLCWEAYGRGKCHEPEEMKKTRKRRGTAFFFIHHYQGCNVSVTITKWPLCNFNPTLLQPHLYTFSFSIENVLRVSAKEEGFFEKWSSDRAMELEDGLC